MTLGRIVLVGLMIGALIGAVAGLVLGLIAYPPTAWFGVIELGIPGAVAGAAIGVIVGLFVAVRRRSRMTHSTTH